MGTNYSAGVFFGACAKHGTRIGERQYEYIDQHEGSPAPTGLEGIEIGQVGSQSTGDIWLTVQAKGSAMTFGRNEGECPEPKTLVDLPENREAIAGFLLSIGGSSLSIGWHFQGSVW